ncbi:MAG TPA: hypothetical protein VKT80_00935 [Chloroflexota bacterium]|nr:hypothetical protein [Chloroflexota bacterium]
MPAIELSIGAHEGSIVIDWGQPRAWIALPPEGVPSFISAVVSAAIEAQKQIREAEFLAKREAEKKAQEQVVSDQW